MLTSKQEQVSEKFKRQTINFTICKILRNECNCLNYLLSLGRLTYLIKLFNKHHKVINCLNLPNSNWLISSLFVLSFLYHILNQLWQFMFKLAHTHVKQITFILSIFEYCFKQIPQSLPMTLVAFTWSHWDNRFNKALLKALDCLKIKHRFLVLLFAEKMVKG